MAKPYLEIIKKQLKTPKDVELYLREAQNDPDPRALTLAIRNLEKFYRELFEARRENELKIAFRNTKRK